MTARSVSTVAARIRRTVALAGASLLIVGLLSAALPPAWLLPTLALADPGGNGSGNGKGASNGNGGKSGEHGNKGKGPGGNGAGSSAGSGNGGGSGEHGNEGKGASGNGNGKGASNGNGGESGERNNSKGPGDNGTGSGPSTGNAGESGGQANSGQGPGGNGTGGGPTPGNAAGSGEHADDDQEPGGSGTGDSNAGESDEPANSSEEPVSDSISGTAVAQAGAAGTTGRGGHDYVRDELVVANLGDDARHDIGRLGFSVLDEQRMAVLDLTITRLRVPRQMSAPAARALLANRYPGVIVDLNAVYRPQGQLVLPPPDYPAKLIGWGRAPDACGEGLRIGLLDTAVDAESPGLRGARVVQRSFLPAGAEVAPTDHGTAIAAILVGQQSAGGAGLLPGAELVVAGAFGADADGTPIADVMALIGGLDWLVGSRTAVINMSFAGDANAVVALALRRVTAGHAVVVAAAGNGGPTAPPAFPADEPGVIGVTAVDSHSQPYAGANRGEHIDFAAPGVRIWTPGPTPPGSYHTGTSFAAPFVTTAVAARLASGATADADRIVDSLAMSATDLGPPGKDPVFGRGLIQLANPCSQPTQLNAPQ